MPTKKPLMTRLTGLLLALCFAYGPVAQAEEDWDDDWDFHVYEPDPWEGWNRKVFVFNEKLDTYAIKPVATGYRRVTPQPVRRGVRNFFKNIWEVKNMANNGLQGKFRDAGVDLSRFMLNSTIGVFGIFDVATKMGLQRNDEDFGQTLGKWGVPSGPYVVLPVLGHSNLRDAPALIPDAYTGIYPYMNENAYKYGLILAEGISLRESLFDSEKMVTGDRYVFIRNGWLQNREYKVLDGMVEDDF